MGYRRQPRLFQGRGTAEGLRQSLACGGKQRCHADMEVGPSGPGRAHGDMGISALFNPQKDREMRQYRCALRSPGWGQREWEGSSRQQGEEPCAPTAVQTEGGRTGFAHLAAGYGCGIRGRHLPTAFLHPPSGWVLRAEGVQPRQPLLPGNTHRKGKLQNQDEESHGCTLLFVPGDAAVILLHCCSCVC